jgi:hypothetical protein
MQNGLHDFLAVLFCWNKKGAGPLLGPALQQHLQFYLAVGAKDLSTPTLQNPVIEALI